MVKSNGKRRSKKALEKPKKPYPEFPLGPANNGRWQKKIRGRVHYFGAWAKVVDGKLTPLPYEASWQAALALYKAQADDLHAGRTPRPPGKEDDGLT